MYIKISFKLFSLMGMLAILLASCAPATTKTSPPSQPSSSSQSATSTIPEQTPTPTQPINNTITIVIPEDPPSFNAVVAQTGYDTLVLNLVMLGLTGVDSDGKVYPVLASELPTVDNGDVKVDQATGKMDVTWKLRTDVYWSDGVPVTADDVVFTWKAIADPNTGQWIQGRDSVDSVEKIDDHTVVFHYNSVYPSYQTQLGGEWLAVWPAHYCDPKQGFVSWDCARKPLSDGPFILQEWQVGDHMTFVRNPKYYEPGKPYLDKIIVKIVPDDSVRQEMMVKGDADLFMWVSETIAQQLQSAANVKVDVSPTNRWVLRLFPNEAARGTTDPAAHPNPMFSDVRVRQAMRMAIDTDTIAKTAFLGYSTPIWSEFNRAPYACNIPRPEYNPDKAAAMLQAAGWIDTNGDGVRECHGCGTAKDGYVMQGELATYPDYGQPMILAQQLIAEMLKKIGIDMKLITVEGNIMWADPTSGGTEQNGNYDLDLWDDGYAGIDPGDFITQYYASASAVPGQGQNIVRWKNPQFDQLLTQINTLDENQRKTVFCQMAQILDNQVPVILLTSIINADAYNVRMENVHSNINNVVSWNAADWKVTK